MFSCFMPGDGERRKVEGRGSLCGEMCMGGKDFSTGPVGSSRKSVKGQGGGNPFLFFGSPVVASLLR